jgi:GT2 family glycosyltransferase
VEKIRSQVTCSVVIPATDGPPTLARCLAAVQASAKPPEELIVVETPATAGPSEARNLGARQAHGDVIVFVDSDVEIHADAFLRIRRAFQTDEDLDAVFGSYDDDPAPHGMVSDFRNLLHHHVHQEGAGPATTFWAGLGAIRRDSFLRLGGFDALRFPEPSVEDIDLGMRLVAAGGRIVLDPAIQGKHLKRWTLASMARTDLLRRGVPWVRLLLEQRSASTALNLGWRRRAGAAACLGLVAATAAGRPRLAACFLITLVGLNRPFYALLLRKRGPAAALSAIPLQVLHDLTSGAAVPLGVAAHLLDETEHQSLLA